MSDPSEQAPTGPSIAFPGPPASPPMQPPPPQFEAPYPLPDPGGLAHSRVRPWWGIGDIFWGLLVTVAAIILGILAVPVVAIIEGTPLDDLDELIANAELSTPMIVIPTLIQQGAWFLWPFVVSKWKGLGPASDWGFAFKPIDLGIGVGVALMGLAAAGAAGAAVSALVGLEDDSLAENTGLLTDAQGSPWLWGMLFVVIVGAPLSEEVLFRGLVLRCISKRFGTWIGGVASLLIFVVIHFPDSGDLAGIAVLWASILALGAVLTVTAIKTNRLGAAIIAHMVINAFGALGALGYLDNVV